MIDLLVLILAGLILIGSILWASRLVRFYLCLYPVSLHHLRQGDQASLQALIHVLQAMPKWVVKRYVKECRTWQTRHAKRKLRCARLTSIAQQILRDEGPDQVLKKQLTPSWRKVLRFDFRRPIKPLPGRQVGRAQDSDLKPVRVIAVAHERFDELKVFVGSFLSQTAPNWKLTVIHDGPHPGFVQIMSEFQSHSAGRIEFLCSETRFNDYGHSLRDWGIRLTHEEFIILTNADNYFIPKAIHFINEKLFELNHAVDILLFDMVHSHENPGGRKQGAYKHFDVSFHRFCIDVSSAVVRTKLAQKVGFRDRTHDGDATFFEDIQNLKDLPQPLRIAKIHKILFVHN